MAQKATIRVPGLKVAVPLPADTLPQDLVPMEGPAGEPVIELVLAGSNLTVIARCNGKNYRKMLKTIAEQGAGNVAVVLQGTLRPPADQDGPYLLEGGRVPGQHQDAPAGSAMRPGPDTAGWDSPLAASRDPHEARLQSQSETRLPGRFPAPSGSEAHPPRLPAHADATIPSRGGPIYLEAPRIGLERVKSPAVADAIF